MSRPFVPALALLLFTASGLGAQAAPRVSRVGAARSYGPGIIQASVTELRFELSKDAYVIVLQVDPAGGITPMFPSDSEPPLRPSGVHTLTAPAPTTASADAPRLDPVVSSAAELARAGRASRPPAVDMGRDTASAVAYWLVIVSDIATSGREVRGQLESLALNYRSVEEELRALPAALVGKRAKSWGAYYVAVF